MRGEPDTKIVRCCLCEGLMRVSARALSVFCPHCQRRVSLEMLRIIGSHPGKALATCGDIVVESSAMLNLAVTGRNIVIKGRVRGPVTGAESVELGPTGHVIGDIKSPKITVADGGIIEGSCEIVRPGGLCMVDATAETSPAETNNDTDVQRPDPGRAPNPVENPLGVRPDTIRPKPLPRPRHL